MIPLGVRLTLCILALAPLAFSESGEVLQIQSTYPVSGNYSYVELTCLDTSKTAVLGASFQLNGTIVAENVQHGQINFTLTQENEGFFTCSLAGLLSTNAIGLAAEPNTSYADMDITYDVELPNIDSTETRELICDIQPGALRQRYSVDWIGSNFFFGDTFNITVNVSYSLFDKLYQCIVTVDHNGQGITRTYEGRYITIHSTIPDDPSGLSASALFAIITFATIGFLYCCCCCCFCCLICCRTLNEGYDETRTYRRFQEEEENGNNRHQEMSPVTQSEPACDDVLPMQAQQHRTSVEEHLQSFQTEMEDTFETLSFIQKETPKFDEAPTPTPFSGPVIDPYNTQSYLPEWFTPVASHLECTHSGMTYYDDVNSFRLEIPEGAIPRGLTISIDIGVALYGPFQFPQGLRPASPVFWICVRQLEFSQFLKPVIITLPHFLSIRNDEDIEFLGLTFLKAKHEMNEHQMYEFQQAEGSMHFSPHKKSGVLETTHFCSLCISCKDIMEAIKRANFCISAVIPRTISLDESSYADFYITFLLDTCLAKLNERLQQSPHQVERECYEFQFRDGEQTIELVLPEPVKDEWIIGYHFKKKISVEDVDFFVRDMDDIKKEQLKLKEENGMYPPRIRVVIGCFPLARPMHARFQFTGATDGLIFDVILRPQPSSPPHTAGSITSHGSSGFGEDELAITDIFDVKTKLTPVVGNWKKIGLALGLDFNKLSDIKANYREIDDCLLEMLSLWLNRSYNVQKHGAPTWNRLSEAVRHRAGGNNPSVADELLEQH